ncbi:carboxylating nicotinate-nucleotide diphosphorylase [Pyrodictium delaneyi]|nr:carboxylating nicotinate-nucleotide diphosphorylase [Pyrodictium delaneyi]
MALARMMAEEILQWLREDMPHWDLTTDALGLEDVCAEAVVVAKSRAVAACTAELARALRILGLDVEAPKKPGELVEPGDIVLRIRGPAGLLLALERTILNLLIYAFGVATQTRRMVDTARRVAPGVRVAATRKTPPGLRVCVKRAFAAGGGDTHRLGLSDAILVKDNHVALVGDYGEALRRVLEQRSFMHRVEVEASTPEEALTAARLGVDAVLLDNMSPDEVRETILLLEREGVRSRIVVEASGGITPENIAEYAATGVDVVSTSYPLLYPARVDLSMRMRRLDQC